jgi:hypothetical protein
MWHLGLHAHESLDHVDRGEWLARQKHLSRERRAVELPQRHGSAQYEPGLLWLAESLSQRMPALCFWM